MSEESTPRHHVTGSELEEGMFILLSPQKRAQLMLTDGADQPWHVDEVKPRDDMDLYEVTVSHKAGGTFILPYLPDENVDLAPPTQDTTPDA